MSRRDGLLREMGLAPLWRLRGRELQAEVPEQPEADTLDAQTASQPITDRTLPRMVGTVQDRPVASAAAAGQGSVGDVSTSGWDDLEARICACTACRLCEGRTQAVPGVGDRAADWLFVGEGPGAEEDLRGEPFVGQAGKLLDAMLAAIGLTRGHGVYIANTVKCRPPGNRTPDAEEMAVCHPFLARQIALIEPRIIVALGRPAAHSLLGGDVKIAAARGRVFEYRGIPVVVTYHPAYLLRNPQDKAKAWEDLCFARDSIV